ncbi:MAG: DMT family transporter [Novosphingobium sp.]
MSRQHHIIPLVSVIAGIALFSIMDAFMKRAALVGGVYTALLLRSVMAGFVCMAIWLAKGGHWPRAALFRLHVLRGLVAAAMAVTFFYGLVRTPMAQAIALSFIAPLIALYLAAVQLGEKIRREAIFASILGFAGVLVIVAEHLTASNSSSGGGGGVPGNEAIKGIVAILFSAVLYAWNLVLQRKQAQLASPLEVVTFQNLVVSLALLPALPLLWQTPHLAQVADIGGAALLATGALVLLSWGYARAEAQVLLPIEYTAFIWAALMGWLWFDESLTAPTLIGVALIVIGCWIGSRGPKVAVVV